MEEESKAIQEVAKTTGKALEVTEKVGGFLCKVLGDSFQEMGGAFHDWTKFYRYKNLLKIHDKVEAIQKERQSKGKTTPIPPRYAIPLIQSATQEDDESIQDLWAGLIANAIDPEKRLNVQKIYIDILSALEPIDTKVLKFLYSQGSIFPSRKNVRKIDLYQLSKEIQVPLSEIEISTQNLFRLGCIREETSEVEEIPGIDTQPTYSNLYPLLTPLAYSLLGACGT